MATGQPVTGLLDLDADTLLTIQEVHEQRFTRTEELLAQVVDAINVLSWNASWAPHVDPRKAFKGLKPPKPMPRPGDPVKPKRRGTTLGELRAMR